MIKEKTMETERTLAELETDLEEAEMTYYAAADLADRAKDIYLQTKNNYDEALRTMNNLEDAIAEVKAAHSGAEAGPDKEER